MDQIVIILPFNAFNANYMEFVIWISHSYFCFSHYIHWSILSSDPIMYWWMRLFIHSGQILNILPILFGLIPSFILKCIILAALDKKFLDSLVHGLNTSILFKLSFFWFWILSNFTSSYSIKEWFSSEYCLSWLDLCIMTISPSNVGQRIFPQARYDVKAPNSLFSSLQSSLIWLIIHQKL